ncbi:hypothetical protein LCGC14_0972090 [marine sediment metagenome]|uniref:DUF1540 domain-containing protein n=1 Tax=marine sediment metagenome TaxID=412755 RepID=A0A0F9NFV6_9ZZZZ
MTAILCDCTTCEWNYDGDGICGCRRSTIALDSDGRCIDAPPDDTIQEG